MPLSEQANGSNRPMRATKPVAVFDKSTGMWYLRLNFKGSRASRYVRKKTNAIYENKTHAESFRDEFQMQWNNSGGKTPTAAEQPSGAWSCLLIHVFTAFCCSTFGYCTLLLLCVRLLHVRFALTTDAARTARPRSCTSYSYSCSTNASYNHNCTILDGNIRVVRTYIWIPNDR